jgi:hypothetical protein
MRRNEYSMTKGYQPASGRHTLTGTLARNIFNEMFWVGISDTGSVVVDAELESCEVAFYRVKVKSKNDFFNAWSYNVFVGKTRDGRVLSHDECAEIMDLPVVSFTKNGETYGERDGISKEKHSHELDRLITPDEYTKRALPETSEAVREEIERLKVITQDRKIGLERNIEAMRAEVNALMGGLGRTNSLAEKVQAEKRKSAAQKELKKREQQLFLDGMRLDVELDGQMKKLAEDAELTAEVKRQFVIRVEGK